MKTYYLNDNKIEKTIDGLDALKQTIKHSLEIAIGETEIFSWGYGNDLLNVLDEDSDVLQVKSEKCITNALIIDDRINDVYDFSFTLDGESLYINFTVDTIYGPTESEVII